MVSAGELLRRWAVDDSGQDLIEYALLGALVGLAGALAYTFVGASLAASYAQWDSGVQDLWDMPAPSGS